MRALRRKRLPSRDVSPGDQRNKGQRTQHARIHSCSFLMLMSHADAVGRYGGVSPSSLIGQFVKGIQSRDLVAFGESGIVKHGPQEILESAAQLQDGLSDMDQFCCARPNGVDAQ